MKLTIKSMVATVVLSIPLTLAAAVPALADDATDQQFLQAVKAQGLHITDNRALSVAHSTCTGLQSGGTIKAALAHVTSTSSLTGEDAATFTKFAVYTYCRQYMPK